MMLVLPVAHVPRNTSSRSLILPCAVAAASSGPKRGLEPWPAHGKREPIRQRRTTDGWSTGNAPAPPCGSACALRSLKSRCPRMAPGRKEPGLSAAIYSTVVPWGSRPVAGKLENGESADQLPRPKNCAAETPGSGQFPFSPVRSEAGVALPRLPPPQSPGGQQYNCRPNTGPPRHLPTNQLPPSPLPLSRRRRETRDSERHAGDEHGDQH